MNKWILSFLFVGVICLFQVPTVFADANVGIKCTANPSPNYEMIFDCYKKLDVNKPVLETMFDDIQWVSGAFNDAKLSNIKQNDGVGTARMEIPVVATITLKSDIKFTQNNSDYEIDFLTGKLAGSKMSISVSATDGFDGTPNMGSDVSLKFKIKKKMCFGIFILKKCAEPDQVIYALDKGLVLVEPKAKIFQRDHPELIATPSTSEKSSIPTTNNSFVSHETYKKIQTDPEVKKIAKEFDLQPKKEYFPVTTLPKNVQGSDKITVISDKDVYVYGTDIIVTTIVQHINNQPIILEFYNAEKELVLTKQVYPNSNGFSEESFRIGKELPAKIHDVFTIFASYGDSKVSETVYLTDWGVSVELDQTKYSTTEKVYLTVIAPDFNRNSNVIDTIGDDEESSITISTDRGYITDYTLVEFSKDAGIFTGEITLVADSPTEGTGPTGGKLAAYPDDELQVWLSESHRDVIETAKISAEIGGTTVHTPQTSEDESITETPRSIPSWVKNNAEWWASGLIEEGDFIKAIEYMIKEKIIVISVADSGTTKNIQHIPQWVKQSAGWWTDGIITDEEFVKGLEYLVKQGIIKVN